MNERRIKPGETEYNPFMTLNEAREIEAKIEEVSEPYPENPREGQLWLMPSDGLSTRFATRDGCESLVARINAMTGRSDTHVTGRRYTVLQFRNGFWESLVY